MTTAHNQAINAMLGITMNHRRRKGIHENGADTTTRYITTSAPRKNRGSIAVGMLTTAGSANPAIGSQFSTLTCLANNNAIAAQTAARLKTSKTLICLSILEV